MIVSLFHNEVRSQRKRINMLKLTRGTKRSIRTIEIKRIIIKEVKITLKRRKNTVRKIID